MMKLFGTVFILSNFTVFVSSSVSNAKLILDARLTNYSMYSIQLKEMDDVYNAIHKEKSKAVVSGLLMRLVGIHSTKGVLPAGSESDLRAELDLFRSSLENSLDDQPVGGKIAADRIESYTSLVVSWLTAKRERDISADNFKEALDSLIYQEDLDDLLKTSARLLSTLRPTIDEYLIQAFLDRSDASAYLSQMRPLTHSNIWNEITLAIGGNVVAGFVAKQAIRECAEPEILSALLKDVTPFVRGVSRQPSSQERVRQAIKEELILRIAQLAQPTESATTEALTPVELPRGPAAADGPSGSIDDSSFDEWEAVDADETTIESPDAFQIVDPNSASKFVFLSAGRNR